MKLVGLLLVLGVVFLSTPGAIGTSVRLLARKEPINFQTFPGALGGVRAPKVTQKGNLFFVEGGPKGEQFTTKGDALKRSCDRQSNQCANFFNNGGSKTSSGDIGSKVNQCTNKLQDCLNFIKTIN